MEAEIAILLSNKNASEPIGAFDGLVACCLKHVGRTYLVTSPNQQFIPLPVMGDQETRMRTDMRYGAADFAMYPQPLMSTQSHLPLIRKKPSNDKDPRAILWWNPTHADFVASTNGLVDGLGEISSSKLAALILHKSSISREADAFILDSAGHSQLSKDSVRSIKTHLDHSLQRLSRLKMTYSQMVLNVVDFQRTFLELEAFLCYMTVVRPRFGGWKNAALVVHESLGTFTKDPQAAQKLFDAGVPLWFIREWDGKAIKSNILAVVVPIQPHNLVCIQDTTPPSSTIAVTPFGSSRGYEAIVHRSIDIVLCPDTLSTPFPANSPPPPVALSSSSSSASRSSAITRNVPARPHNQSQRRVADPYVKPTFGGRNKFLPLENRYAPYAIPAWTEGLKKVDYAPINYKNVYKEAVGYCVPEPGLIACSARIAHMLTNWLQIRPAWLACLGGGGRGLKNQTWRDILSSDVRNPPLPSTSTASKSSQRRNGALECLQKTLGPRDIQQAQESVPRWNGQTISPNELPDENVVRQVLWELYELNFHEELFALDTVIQPRSLSSNSRASYDRYDLLMQCFERFRSPQVNDSDVGLAHHDFRERLVFLQHLARVMLSWPGHPPCVDHLVTVDSRRLGVLVGETNAALTEVEMARFYCQTFFNEFGRAAQIPHRLYKADR
ncbi:hypothetical protein CVT24_000721 [Panaeolus cyanescens]|uniref:Uncharacterized protein n=1 Tax=Panaeolus cyanescens TaxID=181874 RepID=A0A409YT80_9AGAR|nr:hypothetical protein CVT24_000721 [Panaeolus cyanescens]